MIELIDFAGDEGLIGFFLSEPFRVVASCCRPLGPTPEMIFADLDGQAGVDFLQGSPAAHHEVPDGDGEFAGRWRRRRG